MSDPDSPRWDFEGKLAGDLPKDASSWQRTAANSHHKVSSSHHNKPNSHHSGQSAGITRTQ